MADIGLLTVQVDVKRRSLLGRLFRLPLVLRSHYRTVRRDHGRIVALYYSWLLASLVISIGKSKA